MMTVRAFLAVLVTMIAVAPVVAHAGGGGFGLGGFAFFQCWLINGANPPHELSVNDQFTNATRVRVGQARLLCAPADGAACTADMPECQGRTSPTLEIPDGFSPDHLTCYDRPLDLDDRSGATVRLTDPYGVQTVRVIAPVFTCVQSAKECLPDPRTGQTRCPVDDTPTP